MASYVALRKESVDRNITISIELCNHSVALRKESVDRNFFDHLLRGGHTVALRKESVDRNREGAKISSRKACRSPQGERG